jgi:hypothetical protein
VFGDQASLFALYDRVDHEAAERNEVSYIRVIMVIMVNNGFNWARAGAKQNSFLHNV